MAAPLGFKTFTVGEVLSAADVNGYLMQGVLVFATTAARDAAITSPQEGQFAFTKDTNSLFYYDGAAWVASGATGDIEGVTAGTGISGGGTSGTVTVTNSMATEIDAKGDLIVGTGADTFSRLAVGTDTYTLVADSAEATGLKWAAPASGGGMTLIQETVANADTGISFGSIAGTYKQLLLVWSGLSCSNSTTTFQIRLNNSSSSVYRKSSWGFNHTGTVNVSTSTSTNLGFYNGDIGEGVLNTNLYDTSTGSVLIDNYASATKVKQYSGMRRFTFFNGEFQWHSIVGFFSDTTAITSVDLVRTGGAGTLSNSSDTSIRLYGIS